MEHEKQIEKKQKTSTVQLNLVRSPNILCATLTTTGVRDNEWVYIINNPKTNVFVKIMPKFLNAVDQRTLVEQMNVIRKEYGRHDTGQIAGETWTTKRESFQLVDDPTTSQNQYVYNGASDAAVKLCPFEKAPLCTSILDRLEALFGERPNLALVVYYSDGSIALGPHHDKKKGLHGCIIALTLGASRKIVFVDPNNTQNRYEFVPPAGSLYAFSVECNDVFKHSVPVQRKVLGWRYCLTFRFMNRQQTQSK